MKSFKFKGFVIVFFILMFIQFLIGLIDILMFQTNNEPSPITSNLIAIISFPVSLINEDLPFYISHDMLMVVVYWIINLMIQSAFVYATYVIITRIKNRNI